ncbi:MAG: hypothetical protein ABJG68_00420 [Crocinitomicaceae bacterium]
MNEKVIGLIRTGGVLLLFIIGLVLIWQATGTTATVDKETQELKGDAEVVTGSVTFTMYLIYGCLILIGGFTIWSIVQNPKRFIPSAIGIVVFLVLAGVAYGIASSDIIPELIDPEKGPHADMTESSLKWGGTGIKLTFILIATAAIIIVVSSVMSAARYFTSK